MESRQGERAEKVLVEPGRGEVGVDDERDHGHGQQDRGGVERQLGQRRRSGLRQDRSSSVPTTSHIGVGRRRRPGRRAARRRRRRPRRAACERSTARRAANPAPLENPTRTRAWRSIGSRGSQIAHDRVDEPDVVGRPRRVVRVPVGPFVEIDLVGEVEAVPLRDEAAAVEHAVAQAGREDGHEPGRVGLLAPAGAAQELLPGARAAVEHEHHRPPRPGDRRPARHVDDEPARVTVDLDDAAVDPGGVRGADRALRGTGAGGERALLSGVRRWSDARGDEHGEQQASSHEHGA